MEGNQWNFLKIEVLEGPEGKKKFISIKTTLPTKHPYVVTFLLRYADKLLYLSNNK